MSMVNVRIVMMRMSNGIMLVRMRMRLFAIPRKTVCMLVVLIVSVVMAMK